MGGKVPKSCQVFIKFTGVSCFRQAAGVWTSYGRWIDLRRENAYPQETPATGCSACYFVKTLVRRCAGIDEIEFA